MYSSSFHVKEHRVPTSYIREYPRATADNQEDVLHLAVKQYTPRDQFQATQTVTIIGAHANGFPKELYEPLWDELFVRLKAKNVQISGIWIADVAHQGASGVLNERLLGNDPSWMDHPRDLFLMINHFRAEMKRPLIGIGHSMGGNNLVQLSFMHPRLFTTLILIDPVIQKAARPKGNYNPAKASSKRRDQWPSRQAADTAFKRNKFYQAWDPRVLDNWIKYGLRDLPTALYPSSATTPVPVNSPPNLTADPSTASALKTGVTLTTTKHQEVLSFLRLNNSTPENPFPTYQANKVSHPDVNSGAGVVMPFYRPETTLAFERLEFLRPSVQYIFGDESDLSAPELIADKMARTGVGVGGSGGVKAGRVAEVTFQGIGHLIPMEAVDRTADTAAAWIIPELKRWKVLEVEHEREWARVAREHKNQLSEEYIRVLSGDLQQMQENEAAEWRAKTSKL